jgi:hypothetical protein
LANSPFFGFLAVFEDPIAGCLTVRIYDYDTEVMVLALSFVLLGHDGFYAEVGRVDV